MWNCLYMHKLISSKSLMRLILPTSILLYSGIVSADYFYSTDFNSLTIGQTTALPGTPGQGGWYQQLAVGSAYGEIQDSVAFTGRALHQYTDVTNLPGQQTMDQRNFGNIDISNAHTITLSASFLASSSSYETVNTYDAFLGSFGGPHPGFELIGFGLYAGNGSRRSETALQVFIAAFNGSNNNERIPLTVGQN